MANVRKCFQCSRCQEIDLFGEIGGCSFTPDGSAFFLCVADVVYSSLMEFTAVRSRNSWLASRFKV